MSKIVKSVTSIFSPDKPKVPDYSAQQRKEEQAEADARKRLRAEQVAQGTQGRASTLLTGGSGLLDDESEARKVLVRK